MLENQGLYFVRATELHDPFEGSYARANEQLRKDFFAQVSKSSEMNKELVAAIGNAVTFIRQWVMVNCWHMNTGESAAMWNLYSQAGSGVCVQSTYARLQKCLAPVSIGIGVVHYIDYATQAMPEGNVFHAFLHKRKSFIHEQELRAITFELPTKDGGVDTQARPAGSGKWVSVGLNDLIEKIYVAPSAKPWELELLQRVAKRYGLKAPVVQSDLDQQPFF